VDAKERHGSGPPDVSKHDFSVAYDGVALVDTGDHSIDVQALAPALLAFGRLIREANTEFNGKRSTAKVLVVSDFEHKCFNINFEVVVSLFQQIQAVLGAEPAQTAKTILEWLGLLGITGGGAGTLTYLGYLKWKAGRKVSETRAISDTTRSGIVEVRIEGDGNTVQVHNHVYDLSLNPRALRATRDAFLPLGQDGFDNVKLRQGEAVIEEIDSTQVEAIIKSCNVGIEEAKEEPAPEVEVTPAWLSVYSPVFDPAAPLWRFRLGKEVIYADISETNIAQEAIARGGVGVEDAYQVRLEITTEIDSHGSKEEPQYKVLQVIRFVPAPPPSIQASLFGIPAPRLRGAGGSIDDDDEGSAPA
jgi:hypothetical protein